MNGRSCGAIALVLALVGASAHAVPAVVTHVSDGDTVWVREAGHRPYRLRLDGLDAPERCQRGGAAARDALAARVLDHRVDVTSRAHDRHGRAIGTLRLAGEDVGAWLVAHGHAWNARHGRRSGPYAAQERAARAARRGLFADDTPELPRDFRRHHGPCPAPGAAHGAAPGLRQRAGDQ